MGRNLVAALRRADGIACWNSTGASESPRWVGLAAQADMVFHLAGVNRPKEEREFAEGNADLTRSLCRALEAAGRPTPLVLSSSIQAELDNSYGRSKRDAEDAVLEYHRRTGAPVSIFRFPNVFGKWSRPNYNTVVATFCHNISRGLPVQVNNPDAAVRFIYIDDVVRAFLLIVEQRRARISE